MVSKISALSILILGLFSLAGISAQSISCYECVSTPDAPNTGCFDPMSSSIGQVSCLKASGCLRVSYNMNETAATIQRSCKPDLATCELLQAGIMLTNPKASNFNCLTCQTDRCNSAIVMGVTLTALVFGMIVARIF